MTAIDEQLDRIARKDVGKPRKKVVVAGAGLAGLVSAFELGRLGHAVELIEATGRVGGRVWTHRFTSGQYHELGAMRIPGSHDYTRHYVELLGLGLRPFVTAHREPNAFYFLRGQRMRIGAAGAQIASLYRLSAREEQVLSGLPPVAIFGEHLAALVASLSELDWRSLFGDRFLTERAAELERLSLGDFLESCLESDDARELIGAVTGLEVWWDKALSMFLRDEYGHTGDDLAEIVGGADRLPTGLAAKLKGGSIRFNTEVVSLQLVERGVRLRTRATDPEQWDCPPLHKAEVKEELADHLICTIPFGVLRRMPVESITPLKARAIRNLNYAASTKVLFHCKERFWENGPQGILGGASMSDLISRATYYPSDHVAMRPPSFAEASARAAYRGLHTTFALEPPAPTPVARQPGEPGVLVGSYAWGRDALRLAALPADARAEAVLDAVEKMHPEVRQYVDDRASMAWDTFAWSRGAFCFMRPGDLKNYYFDAIRPEGRLHFSGEHCSLHQAWMQGAIMSGLRAVEEVVSEG